MSKGRSFVIVGSLQSPMTGSKLRGRYLSSYLAKKGNQVTYLEPTDPSSNEKLVLPGVKCIKTDYPNWPSSTGMIKATWENYKELNKIKDPDYILALKPIFSSFLPSRLNKGKISSLIVDIDDIEYAYWEKNKALAYLLKKFERYAAKKSDLITVHNTALEKYALKQLGIKKNKVLWLPQGLDLDLYSKIRPACMDYAQGKKILIYAANLGVASYLTPILDVYHELKTTKKNLCLVIVGGGSLLNKYKEYCRERGILDVFFLGYLPHEETLSLIAASDIALNYAPETFANKFRSPIKIREYLALGKTVVSNNVGDSSLFKKYVYLSSGSLKDYKSKISRALEAKKPLKRGKEFIYENYGWDKIVDNFLISLDKYEKEKDLSN